MPIPSDLYEKISHLVAENRVNSAIELLEEQLPALRQNNPEQYHAALVLMQDFNEIQERKINGLLVAETETNSFSFRLLEFSRKLGKKFAPPPPPPASPDPLRMAQPAYTAPPPRPRPRSATGPVNAKGPVNARPGSQSSRKSGGGLTFGKLMMYGLAGLGALVVLFIIMELDNEYEDPTNTSSQEIFSPNVNPGALPPQSQTTNQAVTMATLSRNLGNSSWYGDVMGHLSFDETGSIGSYYNGQAALAILGVENGSYYGTYSEPANNNYGTVMFVLGNNNQDLTINSLNENGVVIGSLYQKRQ